MSPAPLPCWGMHGELGALTLSPAAWAGPDLNFPPQHSLSWVTALWGVLFLFVTTFLTFSCLPRLLEHRAVPWVKGGAGFLCWWLDPLALRQASTDSSDSALLPRSNQPQHLPPPQASAED